MKKTVFAVLLLLLFSLKAEFKKNPDPNTLWEEDGKEIVTGDSVSMGKWLDSLKFTPHEKGGFSVEAVQPKKYVSGYYIPVLPDYPFLVFSIKSVQYTKENYRAFGVHVGDSGIGMIANPQPGIFVVNVFEAWKKPPQNNITYMKIYLYGLNLHIGNLAMVKRPENFVTVRNTNGSMEMKPGDTLEFTLSLSKPAEDASIRFYNSYCMPLLKMDGSDKLQLKPVDKDNPILWKGTLKLSRFQEKEIKAFDIVMKTTVLGGDMNVPLWSAIPMNYKPETQGQKNE